MVSPRSLLSAGLGFAALASGAQSKAAREPRNMVPGAYIVEFHRDVDTSALHSSIGEHAVTKRHLNYNLFRGISIEYHDVVASKKRAAELASMPGVRNVFPVQRYAPPRREVEWRAKPGRDYSNVRREDTSDVWTSHEMTNVHLLHSDGFNGTGIKIGVIDSGIDYNHPALGGCFGDGCLISYGTDFVGDAYTGANQPVPGDDPMDCGGHGTHVAGIIAAQPSGNPFGMIGAAPGATLGAYKVFGCDGSVQNDILIAAFNQAYEDGSDIITASIGGVSGWKEEPWAVAVQRIVEQGVPCTVSAGNDGDMGLWYASGASDGKGVASIASVDNTYTPELLTVSTYKIDTASEVEFGWVDGSPNAWLDVTLPIYALSHDTSVEDDGCSALPDDTPDLAEYIVLIRQGTCTYDEKAANAAAFGAQYIMIYSAGEIATESSADSVDGILGMAMVGASVGEKWVEALSSNKEVVLAMTHPDSGDYVLQQTQNTITGGYMSTFTSWGPTYEADVKPQFGAPGGNIMSTYPLALGAYARLSGTSMSCPLVAGVYALIAEKRGTFDPSEIERVLSAAAIPVDWNDGDDAYEGLAPIAQQGAGLIDAYAAAYATTLLSVSNIAWNDTDNFVAQKSFDIENKGDKDVTFELDSVPALAAYSFAEGVSSVADFTTLEVVVAGATITFDKDKVKVPAGGKATVKVTAAPPKDLDEARLPVWSGYIFLSGDDDTTLTIPYQGIGASLKKQNVINNEEGGVYLGAGTMENDVPDPVEDGHEFLLPPQGHTEMGSYEFPTAVAEMLFGSRLIEVLIVPINGTDPGVTSDAKMIRRKIAHPHAKPQAEEEDQDTVGFMGSIGEPAGFSGVLQPRGLGLAPWDGSLNENGKYVNEGSYKFVIRALKIFGNDKGGADEWDIAETVGFKIKYDKAS